MKPQRRKGKPRLQRTPPRSKPHGPHRRPALSHCRRRGGRLRAAPVASPDDMQQRVLIADPSLASFNSVMVDLHSSREAGSAQGPPSATERRECKSRVTLLLRDADSGQIDHMAAEPTHVPHHPCSSSSWLGARGTRYIASHWQSFTLCPDGGRSKW